MQAHAAGTPPQLLSGTVRRAVCLYVSVSFSFVLEKRAPLWGQQAHVGVGHGPPVPASPEAVLSFQLCLPALNQRPGGGMCLLDVWFVCLSPALTLHCLR